MKRSKKPKPLSLVRFDFDSVPLKYRRKYSFKRDASYVFFGEIANMRGHCVVADAKTGPHF